MYQILGLQSFLAVSPDTYRAKAPIDTLFGPPHGCSWLSGEKTDAASFDNDVQLLEKSCKDMLHFDVFM